MDVLQNTKKQHEKKKKKKYLKQYKKVCYEHLRMCERLHIFNYEIQVCNLLRKIKLINY
jgi:hypothetical protein